MAIVEKATLNYTRTINLGDYNQIKLSVMPTIHFEEGDDVAEVLRTTWAACRANVEHAAQPIVAGYKVGDLHGITTEELFLGIPIETETLDDGTANEYVASTDDRKATGPTPEEALKEVRVNYDRETNPKSHYPGIVPIDTN